MLTASGSVLVQGASAPVPQAAQRVRVLRAFLLGGQRQEVGSTVEVSRALAAELLHTRRVELVATEADPAAAASTESAAEATPAAPVTPPIRTRAKRTQE